MEANVTGSLSQSFGDLKYKPLLVDLTVEEGQRLKVIYGSHSGFHAIDLDTSQVFDLYIPSNVSRYSVTALCCHLICSGQKFFNYLFCTTGQTFEAT